MIVTTQVSCVSKLAKPEALDKVVKKWESQERILKFVYEAGPCGYQTYRYLSSKAFECMVAAPSLIPKKSETHIKNNRRGAITKTGKPPHTESLGGAAWSYRAPARIS